MLLDMAALVASAVVFIVACVTASVSAVAESGAVVAVRITCAVVIVTFVATIADAVFVAGVAVIAPVVGSMVAKAAGIVAGEAKTVDGSRLSLLQ